MKVKKGFILAAFLATGFFSQANAQDNLFVKPTAQTPPPAAPSTSAPGASAGNQAVPGPLNQVGAPYNPALPYPAPANPSSPNSSGGFPANAQPQSGQNGFPSYAGNPVPPYAGPGPVNTQPQPAEVSRKKLPELPFLIQKLKDSGGKEVYVGLVEGKYIFRNPMTGTYRYVEQNKKISKKLDEEYEVPTPISQLNNTVNTYAMNSGSGSAPTSLPQSGQPGYQGPSAMPVQNDTNGVGVGLDRRPLPPININTPSINPK